MGSMSHLEKIEGEIRELSGDELVKLRAWFATSTRRFGIGNLRLTQETASSMKSPIGRCATLPTAKPRSFEILRSSELLGSLPAPVQVLADRAYGIILKSDPRHPSLHFKKAGRYWPARVGLTHRALGVEGPEGALWFWIGSHSQYDKLI